MTGQLDALMRLRARKIDQAARLTATAAAAHMAARAECETAADALGAARARRDDAMARRATTPADPHLRDYLDACTARVDEAERALDAARRDTAAAEHEEQEARRVWLRAQVRRNAIGDRIADARRSEARGREQRAADEAQDRRQGAFS